MHSIRLSLSLLFCPLRHVAEYFEELQSRTSDNVEDMKMRLHPYLSHVHENTQEKIITLNDLLRSQVESMSDRIQTTTEDFRQRFEKTSEQLRSTLEAKMEELNAWFLSMFGM